MKHQLKYLIRPILDKDYLSIKEIDELTQIQYLGLTEWNKKSQKQKTAHLISREPFYEGFVNSGYSFLIEQNGQTIGFILAYETIPIYKRVFCEYVAITPNKQGQGLGKLLIQKLIKTAKTNNIQTISSFINLDNPNSIKTHINSGFKIKDRKEAVCLILKNVKVI